MYNNPVSAMTLGAGGVLAVTGGVAPMSPVFIVLGAFALFSTALAITRITPKTQA